MSTAVERLLGEAFPAHHKSLARKIVEIAERRKEKLKTDEYLTNLEQKKL